jgi:hypothetical protein
MQAGTATVLTSVASTTMNLPIVYRQIKEKTEVREIFMTTALQAAIGILILFGQSKFLR